MRRILMFITSMALAVLLVYGGLFSSGYAKGARKNTAKVTKTEKKVAAPTTTKADKLSDKLLSPEEMLRAHGTSQAEIKAMIQRQAGASPAPTAPAAGEQITWQVLSGDGGFGSSTNFGLETVVGQTAVGFGSSTNYNIVHGFLQDFSGASGCCVTPGDYNNDGTFNLPDVVAGIARVFSGGPPPVCQDQADANGDNIFNLEDLTYGIARIFSGGPPPICGSTGS